MAKKKITLVAKPALHTMCDYLILRHNGYSYRTFDKVAGMLKADDILFRGTQSDPPNYSDMRNSMLEIVTDGTWVVRWDPDELPTGTSLGTSRNGALAMADLIRKDLQGKHDAVAMQCYHLVEGNKALVIEYGHAHPRFFLKKSNTRWGGKIHEQFGPISNLYITPRSLGMAALHFSYYSPERLRRKERHYATVPGSGHGPGTLFRNIEAGLQEIPPNLDFQCPEGWLEMVKELE
jgi:hypothetical protein